MRPSHTTDALEPPTEWVDVVDDDDRVVDTVTRAAMRAHRLQHRAVFVAVVSPPTGVSSRRVLVHRRSDHKDIWPGRWDLAVGGVVSAGESYDTAAVREVAEEVGVHGAEPTPLGSGRYVDADVALLGRCYVVVHEGPVSFDDGEVVEARWVTAADLDAMLADVVRTPFVPDSVALVLPLVRSMLG
ncbi:MAG: NUDIX domain-containing protein [Ilumatobacteraceae bacterium]